MSENLSGRILVVEDTETLRELLILRLEQLGHQISAAENGKQALECLQQESFDLVLLDIMMPELSGYDVLEIIRSDPKLRHIPVIMVSAISEMDSVVRCIQIGADDYMTKPYNPTLLKARIQSSLTRKRWHDQEQEYLRIIQEERQKSDSLLLNILPEAIAERLKSGENPIADRYPDATVLFADLVGFTSLTNLVAPDELIQGLSEIFSAFDALCEKYGLEKIKTLGDGYMAVCGVPQPRPTHTHDMVRAAIEMQGLVGSFSVRGQSLQLRIGIDRGPAIGGVLGTKKFSYDVWGNTVNTAYRMVEACPIGAIQVTRSVYEYAKDKFQFTALGTMNIKGKGEEEVYLLTV